MYKIIEKTTPEDIKSTLKTARMEYLDADSIGKIEIWGSSFSDPGEDWCEYVLFTHEGGECGRKRIKGY